MGHFVCVDGFGPVSAEEERPDLPGHGEAHTVPWKVAFSGKLGGISTVTFSAELPIVQETFTRTFRITDGENVIYVQSELESHLGFDRPVNWAEHATIGSPFLEPEEHRDGSFRAARQDSAPSGETGTAAAPGVLPGFRVADGARSSGGKLDLRAVPASPNSLDHMTVLMDPARRLVWVTADQYREAPDPGLCFQARRVSLAAGLGILAGESQNGARHGVFEPAVRRAAARGDPDQHAFRRPHLPLAARQR